MLYIQFFKNSLKLFSFQKGLIQNIVDNYSKDKIVQFLEETLESFKNKNGEKNRTLGGVFIKLIKEDVK